MQIHRERHFRRGTVFIHILLLFLALPDMAWALDIADAVVFDVLACDDVAQSELDRIIQLELQSSAADETVVARSTRLTIHCDGDHVSLTSVDQTSSELSIRRIQLNDSDDSADGKERLIALAAAELILSAWEQIAEQNITPSSAPSGDNEAHPLKTNVAKAGSMTPKTAKRISDPDRTGAKQPRRPKPADSENGRAVKKDDSQEALDGKGEGAKWQSGFGIGLVGSLFPVHRIFLFGGELFGDFVRNESFNLMVGGGVAGGRASRDTGDATLLWVNTSMAFGARRRFFSRKLVVKALLGFRGGYGRMDGVPKAKTGRGHLLQGAVGGPLVRLAFCSLSRPSFGMSMEAGYTLFGIEGYVDDANDVTLSKWWLLLSLNFDFVKTDS